MASGAYFQSVRTPRATADDTDTKRGILTCGMRRSIAARRVCRPAAARAQPLHVNRRHVAARSDSACRNCAATRFLRMAGHAPAGPSSTMTAALRRPVRMRRCNARQSSAAGRAKPIVPQSEIRLQQLRHSRHSRYAFFIGNMLVFDPRFTRISGMWYLVAFGEIQISVLAGLFRHIPTFANQED